MTVYTAELSAAHMRARMYEALTIYVDAMGYPRSVAAARAPMWAEHVLRPGWRAIGAFRSDPAGQDATLVGIAYGYFGAAHQWWYQQVRHGIATQYQDSSYADEVLSDYFELTELHVHPSAQGEGLGELLARALLTGCDRPAVLLSTPEVYRHENRAWRLYRRLAFHDVLRHFTFQGDSRPFAVLGRALPLEPDASAPTK